MHSLKIMACGAALMLIAPIAGAHPAKHSDGRAMKCSDMHAHMHADMKCMSHRPPKAPSARASKSPSLPRHDHNHTGGQPPK